GKAVAEEIGSKRLLWQILFALADMERDPAMVQYYRAQAEAAVAFLASQITNDTLRESFRTKALGSTSL
ncbi:MAG: hypothetical protein KDE51_00525, partial [Anaerolineales bacterium]|nr:hypothetical protein [Anaerolineales bacterium]